MIEGLQQTNISLDKGIVRTPSLGQEGELSECVNLIPHAGEMVRIPEPQVLTEDATGKYLYYTCVWQKNTEGEGGYLSVSLAEPVREDLPLKVTYIDSTTGETKTETLTAQNGQGTTSIELPYLEGVENIKSIHVGNKEFMLELSKEGYVGLKAYKLFEFTSSEDVSFPTEEEQANMPIELQAGELLLETNRCAGKENLIVRNGNTLVYYRPEEGRHVITTLDEGDVEITTIGQTIVVSQGVTKRYFVWGESGYAEQDLLNAVPNVELRLGDPLGTSLSRLIYMPISTSTWKVYTSRSWSFPSKYTFHRYFKTGESLSWAVADAEAGGDLEAIQGEVEDSFWAYYQEQRNFHRSNGLHCFPFFVRWGVKLYDGSVINLSAPIFMMPSSLLCPYVGCYVPDEKIADLQNESTSGAGADAEENRLTWHVMFSPRYLYSLIDASALKDIDQALVQSIVIYATPEIEEVNTEPTISENGKRLYFMGNQVFDYAETAVTDGVGNKYEIGMTDYGLGELTPKHFNYVWQLPMRKDYNAIKQKLTEPDTFYLLQEIPMETLRAHNYKVVATFAEDAQMPIFDEIDRQFGTHSQKDTVFSHCLKEGYFLYNWDKFSLDSLPSRAPLSAAEINQVNAQVVASNTCYSYNSRLFYGGVNIKTHLNIVASQFLSDSRVMGTIPSEALPSDVYLNIDSSYLTVPVGQQFLVGYRGETPYIALQGEVEGLGLVSNDTHEAQARNARSRGGYENSVARGDNWVGAIKFTHQGGMSGLSVWTNITSDWLFLGGRDLKECFIPSSNALDKKWESNNYREALGYSIKGNMIAVTKVSNPWIIESVYELACGEILALSSATEALSEGQFGDFPIYAFTDNGIYALSINDEGGIEAKQPISRDVLLPESKVLQIDKAVVYPTESGLHLLSGRTTQLLSESVEGLNVPEEFFSVPENLFLPDSAPFQQQLHDTSYVYDYANGAIRLFNPNAKEEVSEKSTWGNADVTNTYTESQDGIVTKVNPGERVSLWYKHTTEGFEILPDYTGANNYINIVTRLKAGDILTVWKASYGYMQEKLRAYKLPVDITEGAHEVEIIDFPYEAEEDCSIGFTPNLGGTPLYWTAQTAGAIITQHQYHTQLLKPATEEIYRQKHYVYDLESGQWATQILDRQLTTCVAGYPFSTLQFGRQLMQYNNELEKDVIRSGWLLTRPISFNDPFTRKMLADIRLLGQKTHVDTKFKVQVYISEDRVKWHRLTSLKGRSAKWYRFLIKADMCGLDTLTGITCQYVPRLGNKLR